jgi:hypothetical protein
VTDFFADESVYVFSRSVSLPLSLRPGSSDLVLRSITDCRRSRFHPHYDGRFADKEVGTHERLDHLTALIQTFLATMADLGAETWLMHGTLLGWWWNQKVFYPLSLWLLVSIVLIACVH